MTQASFGQKPFLKPLWMAAADDGQGKLPFPDDEVTRPPAGRKPPANPKTSAEDRNREEAEPWRARLKREKIPKSAVPRPWECEDLDDWHVHHILQRKVAQDHPVFVALARYAEANDLLFHYNEPRFGILLPVKEKVARATGYAFHRGGHVKAYSELCRHGLTMTINAYRNRGGTMDGKKPDPQTDQEFALLSQSLDKFLDRMRILLSPHGAETLRQKDPCYAKVVEQFFPPSGVVYLQNEDPLRAPREGWDPTDAPRPTKGQRVKQGVDWVLRKLGWDD